MIISTTPTLEGKRIKEYKGIVFGEVVSGVDFVKDFAESTPDTTSPNTMPFSGGDQIPMRESL